MFVLCVAVLTNKRIVTLTGKSKPFNISILHYLCEYNLYWISDYDVTSIDALQALALSGEGENVYLIKIFRVPIWVYYQK